MSRTTVGRWRSPGQGIHRCLLPAAEAVDACVIALAGRLDLREVAALERRDFQVVAPRHLPKGQRLRLLPE